MKNMKTDSEKSLERQYMIYYLKPFSVHIYLKELITNFVCFTFHADWTW
jgi:hypothetical protein